MHWFNELAQEQRAARTAQDKEKAKRQEANYYDFIEQNIRKGFTVPNDILKKAADNEDITQQQREKLEVMNKGIMTREGIAQTFRAYNINSFNDKSTLEQEAMISQAMGTSPEQRQATMVELQRKAVDGTLTRAEIEHNRALGRIYNVDADNLREFDTKFERAQKLRIQQAQRDLDATVRGLFASTEKPADTLREARFMFSEAMQLIDPHDKNFDEAVKKAYEDILGRIIEVYSKGKSKGWFSPKAWEGRVQQATEHGQNFSLPPLNTSIPLESVELPTQAISPTGQVVSFDNTAPLYQMRETPAQQPTQSFWGQAWQRIKDITSSGEQILEQRLINTENANWNILPSDAPILQNDSLYQIPQSNNVPPAEQKPMNLGLAMIANGTVTGHFSDWRAYRSGQHNGVDVAGSASD